MKMDVNLGGTPIREEDIKEKKVLYTEWIPKARYAWDAGVAIGRFLEELKNERIIGTECQRCRRIMVPPRLFCELCYTPVNRWTYLEDRGRVRTFCMSRVRWDASRVEEPFFPSVIELDGGRKGTALFHVIRGVDLEHMKVGLRVKAVWKAPEERIGAITDIEYFIPE
jgi:uncharacterized OB-fold protein